MQLKDRERKLDINLLSPEQADVVATQLGEKIKQICDKAVEEANTLLNIYGMQAKMQIFIDGKDSNPPQSLT
jgi:hypothetical protein